MVGRISAGVLADVFSWRVALGVVGGVGLLGALWFMLALPASSNSSARASSTDRTREAFFEPLLRPLKDPGLVCVFVVGFLLMSSFMTLFN
jgi:YNFM family putative membrane transporter